MIAVCQAEIGPKYRTWRQNVNSKDSFNAEAFPKMQNNDRPGSTKPKFMIFPGKHRKGRHTATRQGTRGDPDNKYTQYDNGR